MLHLLFPHSPLLHLEMLFTFPLYLIASRCSCVCLRSPDAARLFLHAHTHCLFVYVRLYAHVVCACVWCVCVKVEEPGGGYFDQFPPLILSRETENWIQKPYVRRSNGPQFARIDNVSSTTAPAHTQTTHTHKKKEERQYHSTNSHLHSLHSNCTLTCTPHPI